MEGFSHSQVFGPYRIHGKIASGGMAEVFLATSTNRDFQGQFFALKRLHSHLNSNASFVNLLIHEAKIGVLLNHPGIATVYDLGSYQSEFFLAMEYVHGKSLDRVFEKMEENPGLRLSVELSSYIIMELLRSLAFAHRLKDSKDRPLNIIHRDLSPGNILVSYVGEIKLTDFGIATAESRLQPELSRIALGKLAYMSPEQAVNDPVTAASDLFSVGVLFYELLTLTKPFQGKTSDEVYKSLINLDRAKLFKEHKYIPSYLQSLVIKLLDKTAKKRYQSALETFQAIGGIFKHELNIDFNSRAVRDYYKKKLSETMKNLFRDEITSELALIQGALKNEKSTEITKPIRAPMAPRDDERTVFEQDFSDEATRLLKLSAEDREKILTSARQSATSSEGNFSIPTVSKRVSVAQKLESSLMGKELREDLFGRIPQLELTNDQELAAFEESTFSGEFEVGSEQTRVLDPEKILLERQELEEAKDFVPAPDLYEATELLPPKKNFWKTAQNKIRNLAQRWKENSKTVGVGLLGAGILVGVVLLGEFSIRKLRAPSNSLASFQTIDLFTTGTVSSIRLTDFVRELRTQEGPFDLAQVSDLFNREYRKYKKIPSGEILNIELRELAPISNEAGQLDDARVLQLVRALFPEGEVVRHRFVLFFYPIPSAPNEDAPASEIRRFIPTEDLTVVMAPAYPNYKSFVLLNLSYAIASRFGATSKEDPKTGLSIIPFGIANPFEKPIFPQARAELMARDVPVSESTERPPFTLSEVVIGPQTAFELGWLSEEEKAELLPAQ